ncbi:hypothetical protein [Alteromonas facilis]|uniref:hypothetical protein n=1 Tax=Alteromonas facilis TaxID=2048004 RepID=UPI000F5C8B64|nr:hypothetical protein [Alteromonas facilis]
MPSLKRVLYTAGQNPTRSWARFRLGLALFVFGLLLLLSVAGDYFTLNAVALVILFIGFVFAMWGYWGMFANRFARVIEQREINRANDPFAEHKDKPHQD